MDLEECLLITDATLTHLAMGCPRLEKLVSSDLMCGIRFRRMLMTFGVSALFRITRAFIESFAISERRACHIVS